MKKIIFLLSIIFILLTFFVISNCVGINGNPTELIGTWKAEWTDTSGAGTDTDYEVTVTFNDDGTFKIEHTMDTTGVEVETEIEGNYYGAPSDTPKSVTLELEKFTEETNGVSSDEDYDKRTQNGTYYIVYSSPYKLCCSDLAYISSAALIKQD